VLFDMADVASCAVCMSKAVTSETLNAAYGVRPPAVPGTAPTLVLKCQKTLAKAAGGLAAGWTRALSTCEDGNVRGVNVPPLDCSTDPDGGIARAKAKSASRVASCTSFTGLGGCASTGNPTGTEACFETAIGGIAPSYTGVAYP
jgi:hypothetical protein